MDKEQFINQFIVQFLANHSAIRYTACEIERAEHFPVEDAEFLAEEAWKEYCKHICPKT